MFRQSMNAGCRVAVLSFLGWRIDPGQTNHALHWFPANGHRRRLSVLIPKPNLKQQAKQYLRWHRERYYPVAAQIRAALPRFRHIGDVQILESRSLSRGKWGSTGGRRSNQEQMP
jgi:hypothetical protein